MQLFLSLLIALPTCLQHLLEFLPLFLGISIPNGISLSWGAPAPFHPWTGLHVVGLCVGVGNYRYEDKLDNAVRDAEEVHKKLKSVPNCYSTFLENPSTSSELLRKIIACLKETGLREIPPELFLFYYAGHAIQLNSKVYLVPRMTKIDNRSMYDVECLTLDKLLETLRDTLDLPVRHKMHQPRSISFLVVLDCCRNSFDDALACEPAPQSLSNNTTILFSCSRTKTADDGPSGGQEGSWL
jgi:hypothetical protein